MHCPSCGEMLRKVKLYDTPVDQCDSCGGILFKADQFNTLARIRAEEIDHDSDPGILFKPRKVKRNHHSSGTYHNCPKCRTTMQRFNYAYDSNIFLNKCDCCSTIWTDHGQVTQIAEHLRGNSQVNEFGKAIIQEHQAMHDIDEITTTSAVLSRGASISFWYPKFLLPLGDNLKTNKRPYCTLILIVICTVIFIQQLILSNSEQTAQLLGYVPDSFISIGLFTSIFLHANILHFAFNIYFLWIFGRQVENWFGPAGYIILFVLCSIAGNLAHGIMHLGSTEPIVGASGAVAGIMGAYMVLYPKAVLKVFLFYKVTRIPAVYFLVIWISITAVNAIFSTLGVFEEVAWFTQAGGFAFGAAFVYYLKKTTDKKVIKVPSGSNSTA